jgi:peptidoglycan/xylan/chitin deacetylase (PgdA/CDA1 family)
MNRGKLANALDGMRVPQLCLALRRAASPWLTVLTYHRVAQPDAAVEYDDGVVDVTPERLDRQLAFVTRWFDVVDMADLVAFARGGSLPQNPLLVTFDDGYRDNHDVALPILQRHGVRATFFVATDYVEGRRPFWWDRIAYVVKRSAFDRLLLHYPERTEMSLAGRTARERAVRRLHRLVKDVRGLDLGRFLAALEDATGVTVSRDDERRMAGELVMTWEQVAALERAGMDVQSHTKTHRVLRTLDDAELREELRGSREKLEQVLGHPVRALAYPVGKGVATDRAAERAVRECGYVLGFSNGTGVNVASAFDPYDVRRLALDLGLGEPFFRAMLAMPWLAYAS